jgi:protein tyrosine phosphatase
MKYKSDRIRTEFGQLPYKNMPLFDIITRLDSYAQDTFNKEITLTCILRTKEENDALYASTPPEQRPKATPHVFWGACDLRSSTFSDDEIASLVAWLNSSFKNPSKAKVAIYHCIAGNAPHFHIQSVAPLKSPGEGDLTGVFSDTA